MKALNLSIKELKKILKAVENQKQTNDNGYVEIAENGSVRIQSGYAECIDPYIGKFEIKAVKYDYAV